MPMTLERARLMYEKYLEAEEVIVSGTAKSYTIGNRQLTRLDLDLIHKYQEYYRRMIGILEGTINGRMSRQGVPRDL